jgi:hypothetical protein
MHRRLLVVLALFALSFPTEVLARRAQAEADVIAPGDAAPSATRAAPHGGGAGAARVRIAPDPTLDPVEFRVALQRTSGALEQCLADAGLTGALRVTASVQMSHALDLAIVAPRHDAVTTQCAELVLRRALTAIAARPLSRPLRASLTVRHRTPRPPRVPPPAPPATGELAAFEGPVHAAIERDRSAMIQCLSGAAPGVAGEASLRVTLAPDGSLSLTSASMPTGVPAGPALPCLSARIAQLRFSPAPRRAIAITHALPLGL